MTDDAMIDNKNYYNNTTDAVNQNIDKALSSNLSHAGTYYRAITFTLENSADSYTFDGKDGRDYKINGNTVTFAQPVIVEAIPAKVLVNPLNVKAKTLITDPVVTQDNNYTLTGASFVKVGTEYYKSLKGALNQDANNLANATSGSYFDEGKYYRLLYFKIDSSFAQDYTVADDNLKIISEDTVIYAQPVNVSVPTEIVKNDISLGKANIGENINEVQSGSSQLLDSRGKVISDSVLYSDNYYDNAQDVFDAGTQTTINVDEKGNFTQAGTYYREATFNVTADEINANSFNDAAHIVKNGDNSTVSFVQTVNVIAGEAVSHSFNVINANVGDSVNNMVKATGELKDASGKELESTISVGTTYYDNADDVFSNISKTTENVNADGQFTQSGTYYRKISFKLADSIDIKSYDFGTDAHISGNIVSYTQAVVVGEDSAIIVVGPLNIQTGTKTNDPSVTSTDGYVLTDADGNYVDPTLGETYYRSVKGALDKSNGEEVDINATTKGAFNSGTYYRRVVFKAGSDFADKFKLSNPNVKVDSDGWVIYAQEINVKDSVISKHNVEVARTNVGDQINKVTSIGNYLEDALGKRFDAVVSYGTDYYDSNADVFTPNATKTKSVVNDVFVKLGIYYREINFKISPDAIKRNNFGTESHIDIKNSIVSFVQTVSVNFSAVNIKVDSISVIAGTTTDDNVLKQTTDYTLNNKLGTVFAKVSLDDKYYQNIQSALKQDEAGLVDVNGQFTKTGTYYRVITFEPSVGIDPNSISDPNAQVNPDGTISYVQAVTVTKNDNVNASVGILKLNVNPKRDNPALIDTEEYSIRDAAGNSLVDETKGRYGVELGQEFYTDAKLIHKTDNASGARILKPGTYYRIVKFYLTADAVIANEFKGIDKTDNTVRFVQMIKASVNPATVKINNVTVDNNIAMTDEALQNDDDVYVVDKDGETIVADGGVEFDTTLYDDQGRPVTNLSKAGTYIQVVTVNLIKDATNLYTFDSNYRVNQIDNTISCVRTVTVNIVDSTDDNSSNVDDTIEDSPEGNGDSPVVETNEKIAEDDGWDYSSIKGVATTKSEHQFYSLNDQDNEKIIGRVLGSDFSLEVDQVRVNKDGTTQYRVEDNVWINSDDVVLNQNDSENGDWNYTPVQGMVTTKDGQKQYQVKDQENTVIEDRSLKEGSSWKTDLYRTSKDGIKQYRITTGEWVNEDDVDFEQDQPVFWTYTSIDGVVKAKDDQTEYQLNDQENKVIVDHDFDKNVSWKTDLYRTNEEGVKQYRIAADEWISADVVDFNGNDIDEDTWIYTSVNGIVTIKSDKDNYSIKDQKDSVIADRNLVKDSIWKTDEYRTNRQGIKQYRIATDQWIDSDAVIYERAVDTGVFRDGRKISGVLNLDRTNIFYEVYSRENEIVEDYSLGEETSWKTDYKAQDVNGDTYYHIGDNEWIKDEKGVHLNTYAWY